MKLAIPQPRRLSGAALKFHAQRIMDELKDVGADQYDLHVPETRYLPHVIQADEHIQGAVYGKYPQGRGALVATDKRILFIDKKPLFVRLDDIDFGVVGGITYTQTGLPGIVTLRTRLGDYKLRTFNSKNAMNFVDYVGARCLRSEQLSQKVIDKIMNGDYDDYDDQKRTI